MSDKLIIFDTTLRDGEQSPGASMTRDEKLRIARQLERLRVDVIEAGFAASSEGDFQAVKAIANAITESTVCSLSRANDRDISRAAAPSLRRPTARRDRSSVALEAGGIEHRGGRRGRRDAAAILLDLVASAVGQTWRPSTASFEAHSPPLAPPIPSANRNSPISGRARQ